MEVAFCPHRSAAEIAERDNDGVLQGYSVRAMDMVKS